MKDEALHYFRHGCVTLINEIPVSIRFENRFVCNKQLRNGIYIE